MGTLLPLGRHVALPIVQEIESDSARLRQNFIFIFPTLAIAIGRARLTIDDPESPSPILRDPPHVTYRLFICTPKPGEGRKISQLPRKVIVQMRNAGVLFLVEEIVQATLSTRIVLLTLFGLEVMIQDVPYQIFVVTSTLSCPSCGSCTGTWFQPMSQRSTGCLPPRPLSG
ncbi:hypothetical protein PMIN06_005560 [Paraphaeosphaeria minitans]